MEYKKNILKHLKRLNTIGLVSLASLVMIGGLSTTANVNAKSYHYRNVSFAKLNKRCKRQSRPHLRLHYLRNHEYYRLGRVMAKIYSPDITLEVLKYGKPNNSKFIKGFTSVKMTHGDLDGNYRYNTRYIIKSIKQYSHGSRLFKLGWKCSNNDNMSKWFMNKYQDAYGYKSPINKYYVKYANNSKFKAGWKSNYKVSYYYSEAHPSVWNNNRAKNKNFKRNARKALAEDVMKAKINYQYSLSHSKMFKRGWYDYNHYSKNSNNEMNPKYRHNKQYRKGFFARMKSFNYDD